MPDHNTLALQKTKKFEMSKGFEGGVVVLIKIIKGWGGGLIFTTLGGVVVIFKILKGFHICYRL